MAIADAQRKGSSKRTIEEFELRCKADPSDAQLKIELAETILRHFLYDDTDDEDLDAERLRMLLNEIPEPEAPFSRACLHYYDEQIEHAVKWLLIHASSIVSQDGKISFDKLGEDFVNPFSDAQPEFWKELAQGMANVCPDSAASYYLHALANEGDEDSEASFYKQALDKDGGYWTAAWVLADQCTNEKNWQSASVFYAKALEAEMAQEEAGLHFRYARCLSKLKQLNEEEKHLRICLNLEPDFKWARNDLGVCLQKQARYQEALEIFDKLIEQKADGPYPYRNRAYVLKKLNRYRESIEAWRNRAHWKGCDPSGRIPASIEKEIVALERLIVQSTENTAKGAVVTTDASSALEPIANFADEEPEVEQVAPDTVSEKQQNRPSSGRTAAPREALLEESLEKMIASGQSVFGRRLKVYTSPEGLSGRQFITSGIGGRIDILACDLDTGDFVVIELKKDESHEQVVGQICLYMAWVKQNVATENQNVTGIICVFSASSKLQMAARSIPYLEVFEYGLNFEKV